MRLLRAFLLDRELHAHLSFSRFSSGCSAKGDFRLSMHRDSCLLHLRQPSMRCHSGGRAIYTVLPIVVTLMLLPTIAYVTPPDPWWIAGIYDGGDGDDIVSLIYETSASNAAAVSHVPPLSRLTEASFASIVHRGPRCQSSGSPRSPPTVAFSCLFSSSQQHTPSPRSFLGLFPRHSSRSPVCPDWVTFPERKGDGGNCSRAFPRRGRRLISRYRRDMLGRS